MCDYRYYDDKAKNILYGQYEPMDKYNGLLALLNRIEKQTSDVIADNCQLIENIKQVRFDKTFGAHQLGWLDEVRFVKENFSDIQTWKKETGDILKERQNKLVEYRQTICIKLPPQRITYNTRTGAITHKIEPHPDNIYCKNGSYRKWNDIQKNPKAHPLFELYYNIFKQGYESDFEQTCGIVLSYIAIKNEVENLRENLILTRHLPQSGTKQTTSSTKDNPLLNNPEFDILICKAQTAGLIDNDNVHNWIGQLNQLALFAKLTSDKLMLNHHQNSDGSFRVSWQPFELWFIVDGKEIGKGILSNNYNTIKQSTMKSSEREIVMKLF